MNSPSDPQASTPDSKPRSAQPAHLGWRLLAMVYDLLPLMALWFATSAIVYFVRGQVPVRPGSLAAWGLLALLWAVTGAYFVMSWRRGGQTIGMRPWRLKVLDADGHPATLGTLRLRYAIATLSLLVVGLGFVWALFDDERRCWHDMATGTRFVRMDPPS
jgi:uncharacterized RDD family membrane protein YckC